MASEIPLTGDVATKPAESTDNPASPGKPRGRRIRNRRGELLSISAHLFAENGFAATTMTQISETAGILSGSLYHHFDTKESIFHELMKPFGEELVAGFQRAAVESGTAEEVIGRILQYSFEHLRSNRDLHTILYNERKLIRRTAEFRYIADYGQEINRIVYAALQQGVREKVIRQDINLTLAASMLLRLTNALIDTYEPGGRFELDEIFELEKSLIMDGLRRRD